MDLETLMAFLSFENIDLTFDDDYLDNGNVSDKRIGPGEKNVRERYSLHKNENVGLVIVGNDSNNNYVTLITDQRFIVVESKNKKPIKNIRWNNIKYVEYLDGDIIFKSIGGHRILVPMRFLTELNDNMDENGKMLVSLLKKRFNI